MRSSFGAQGANPASSCQRVLIVDDEMDDARDLGNTMASSGYDYVVSHNSASALDLAIRWQPTVAILDVNMPGMSGLTLCARLKEQAGDPIVIFVTGDTSNQMRKECLLAGDDYITKPYESEDLLLRVGSRLRRHEREAGLAARGAPSARRALRLTPVETRLLNRLIEGAGATVTRDDLLLAVWGEDCLINDNTLDRTIRRLREKIERDPKRPRAIVTARRAGYRLDMLEYERALSSDD